MLPIRTLALLVVLGCGLAVFASLLQVHRGLDEHVPAMSGLPAAMAASDAQALLDRLGKFPKSLGILETRLLDLEESIAHVPVTPAELDFLRKMAVAAAGPGLRGDGAAGVAKSSLGAAAPPLGALAASRGLGADKTRGVESAPATPSFWETEQLAATTTGVPRWRMDHKCGKRKDLVSAECNPDGAFPCCSSLGWCGITEGHCKCRDCVDYRRGRAEEAAASPGDARTASPTGAGASADGGGQIGQPVATKPGGKTVLVVIPFRDREGHLVKFKDYWRWFAAEGRKPSRVSRWEVFVVEQFDSRTFNRGWCFNVGLAIASAQIAASMDINGSALAFDCAAIQDIDYLPEAGVDYAECEVPMQLSAEIDRYKWKTPYMESAGGIVSMSLAHWRKINGFGNEYFGWGGEDDELYHRLRLTGLLFGDCYPFCKKGDPNIGRTGMSIKRPPQGFGRFSGKYMHSANHTKRITDGKAYDRNLKQLQEIKKGSSRWKNDGLSNLAFRILHKEVDTRDLPTHGIVYHHIKVHRGRSNFDLGGISLAVPIGLCGSTSGADSLLEWSLTTLGADIPWDLAALRARTARQAARGSASTACPGATIASFVLLDRRFHIAKILSEDEPQHLVTFYRSLSNPADDGIIIADGRPSRLLREAFVNAGALKEPPTEYVVCQSKQQDGPKYSIHQGLVCTGSGWEPIKSGFLRAYSKPRDGTKAVSWCDTKKYWTQRILEGETCPEKWAGLDWIHGGTFWVPEGGSFCVGTRETPERPQNSFSRLLPKTQCEGDGFEHAFGFRSATEDDPPLHEQRSLPMPLTICIGRSGGRILISEFPEDCHLMNLLVRFVAKDVAAASPKDRVLCVLTRGAAGDVLLDARDCGDGPRKLTFAVPWLEGAPERQRGRPRICLGRRSDNTVENLVAKPSNSAGDGCSGRPSFQAPSVLDFAASTPRSSTDFVGGQAVPLYVLVEEGSPCFSFLCPGMIPKGR